MKLNFGTVILKQNLCSTYKQSNISIYFDFILYYDSRYKWIMLKIGNHALFSWKANLCLVMSARQELISLHSQLRAEFNSETANQKKCAEILEKLKIGLTQISYIPSAGVPLVKEDLLLGRKNHTLFVCVNGTFPLLSSTVFWLIKEILPWSLT